MSCVYSPVDYSLWSLFSKVSKSILERIVLLHVFNERGSSALFITNDDTVYALGSNIRAIDPFKVFSIKTDMFGFLGIGETVHTKEPLEVPELSGENIVSFSSGLDHTLALSESGDLYVWGRNQHHQLGNIHPGTVNRPFLKIKNQVRAIATGDNYSLVLLNNSTIMHFGTLKSEKEVIAIPTVVQFPGFSQVCVSEISCGARHAAVLGSEGEVYIWGDNSEGQLGHGFVKGFYEHPVRFATENLKVEKLGCGITSTIVLYDNGELGAFGCVGDVCKFQRPVISFVVKDTILCVQTEQSNHHIFNIVSSDKMFGLRPIQFKGKNWQNVFGGRSTPQFIRGGYDVHSIPVLPKRDISILYNNKEKSDLKILLKDSELYCHKLILSTFSSYFSNLEANVEVIDVQIYNPNAYRCFIKYIYTGKLDPLDILELTDLYKISSIYSEHELNQYVVHLYRNQLSNNNVTFAYEYAKELKVDELIGICQKFASVQLDKMDVIEELAMALGQILLTVETVSDTYLYATVSNLGRLKDLCADFAARNWDSVVLSKSFENLPAQVRCAFMKDSATIKNRTKITSGYDDA